VRIDATGDREFRVYVQQALYAGAGVDEVCHESSQYCREVEQQLSHLLTMRLRDQ
jgi:hypothetical protein